MSLTFETTHEYYLHDDVDIHYCEDHNAMMISRDYEDRIIIRGIDKETIEKFIAFYNEHEFSTKSSTQQRKTTKRKTQTKTDTTV